MDFPVIISFYTLGTPYEEEVQKLIESCASFKLKTSIVGIESFGSWELNCAYKPFFILDKLKEFNAPVLWVDADGVFIKKPKWQRAFDADLAVRNNVHLPQFHSSRVITSTVFVRPSLGGKDLLRSWMSMTQKSLLDANRIEEFWDQVALRDAMELSFGKVANIPLEYAKIFDHDEDCLLVRDPVIEHYQASRRFKHQVQGI